MVIDITTELVDERMKIAAHQSFESYYHIFNSDFFIDFNCAETAFRFMRLYGGFFGIFFCDENNSRSNFIPIYMENYQSIFEQSSWKNICLI